MGENRLFTKFLRSFFWFVLLPFCVILAGVTVYANRLQLKNDMAQNENLAAQVVNAVSQQTELAQNMCKSVLQNQSILNFFDKEYSSSSDLLYYRTTIYEFVKTTNGMSDIKLRVYLENDSIPMGFGVFYPMRYIDRGEVFQTFYGSGQESVWLDGNFDGELPENQRLGSGDTYHYLHKIEEGSRLLGVVEAMVPKRVLAVHDVLTQPGPVVLDGCYFYNYTDAPLTEDQPRALAGSGENGHTKSLVYSRHELPKGPFSVIVISPRTRITFVAVLAVLLLLAAVAVMLAGFFLYNRRMIQDIHHCLDEMAVAIENDFNPYAGPPGSSIAEISRRRDEISMLAQRITYLLGQIRSLLDQKIQKETAAKEAVLLALQHQINPHFLYNTMEVFSARMELAGLYEESGAISAFCRMLRYNMNTKDMTVAMKQEIRQVKDYLAIQKIRKIPFEIAFDIPPELMEEPVIRFLLEPFVENSFKYRGAVSPLYIRIAVQSLGRQMEITIENNGESISPDRLAELNERFRSEPVSVKSPGSHIGLTNINSRLKLFYGEGHYIQASSGGGITAFRFRVERRALPPQAEKGAPL